MKNLGQSNLSAPSPSQVDWGNLIVTIVLRIRESLELLTILQTTADEVHQLLGCERVLLYQFDPDGRGEVVVESVSEPQFSLLDRVVRDFCFEEAELEPFRQGQFSTRTDIVADHSLTPCHAEFLAKYQIRANLVCPIFYQSQLWGFLIAHNCTAPRQWLPDEINGLQQIAVHVGIALYQASLLEQLQVSKASLEAQVASRTFDLAQLAAIVKYSQDAIISKTLNGTITSWNQAAENLLGYSAQDVIGQNVLMLIPLERQSEESHILWAIHQGERIETYATQRLHQNGSLIDVDLTVSPIRDENDNVIGASKILRDIRDRKQVELDLKLANQRLSEHIAELNQRHWEMVKLSEIIDFLQACFTVDEACKALSHLIEPLFPECVGGIFLTCASRDHVEMMSFWGEALYSEVAFLPNNCWALRRGRVHFVDHRSGLYCNHILLGEAIDLTLCIPMIAQGETLGLFHLSTNYANALTESKQQLAKTLAEQVGLAIANLRLQETLQQQSIRDPLTGLFNRRYLQETFNQELSRAQRQQHQIGVIMLDIDHFKKFNDTYGHEAGDYVLQTVGTLLKKYVRGSDIACRYGGEELILVLPDSSLEIASKRAEEIREAIAKISLTHNAQHLGNLTASLGVASFPQHGATGSAVMQSADAALYRAKAAGRNQVLTAPLPKI
ncbi:diguanylate cyclase [Pseudanabaena sp. FACHB-1998]|uniref:diguanylate cyclase n=1 Tax=Pseudanabaena sp. FACHB-1998 TaxID=2692858 RepID=UPI0016815588|nr:diguanylate cyclase [Pseudanabaena sp. FACHB-1998]MBD2178526.1 diguanylate cyclase [Pseudanabaena sp. FACHB-1998]